MDAYSIIFLALAITVITVSAQFNNNDFDGSPLPPRPVIPGAIPLDGPRRPTFRSQGRRLPAPLDAQPAPVPVAKVRRPISGRTGRINSAPVPVSSSIAPPVQNFQQLEERPIPPRPVVEEPEDHPAEQSLDNYPDPAFNPVVSAQPLFTQSIFPKQPALARPPKPAAFRPERPAFIPTPAPDFNDLPVPSRQQFRTTASPAPAEPQFTRPQQQPQSINRVQQVVRTQPQKQQFSKPQYENERVQPPRERKPVAQTISKYRNDNEDGSITWGFENDDGTFKEETIGTDCVTRGKYGYVDPDGVKREYTYSSGIPCDKTKDSEGAATNEGYIDYQNNRYVLPNGDAVDLDKMVKNRARKPVYKN